MADMNRVEWDPPGEEWALLFRHLEEVDGPRFKVRVVMTGRLLATIDPETGACSIDGVYPGSLFAKGSGLTEANETLRENLGKILEDIMESSETVDDFRRHMEDFMQTTDDVTVSAWKGALTRLRSGGDEGAPDLDRYDASDWSDFAVVEDLQEETMHHPIMAIPAPTQSNLLAAA